MISSPLSRRREVTLILLIWGCFLARGSFYCSVIPLWEGYDEWVHFAYIQHLLAHGTLPVGTETRVSREIEASLLLLPLPWELRDLAAPHVTHDGYWRLTAEERAERSGRLKSIPKAWALEPAEARILLYEAQQPPLYYWLLQWPLTVMRDRPLPDRVFLLRYLSLILASGVIPIGYAVARRTFRHPGVAFGIIGTIAVMPEFTLELSRVANDSLATVLFSLLLLFAIRICDEPGRTGTSLAYGLTLGLGLLTKSYFLTAVPATALQFLWLFWGKRPQRRRILVQGCLIAGTAFAVAGWWYVRNRILLGSWSGLQQDVALNGMSLAAVLYQIPLIQWRLAFDSFFVSHIYFGNWSFLQLRSWIYHFFLYLALIGVIGYLILVWRCLAGKRLRRPLPFDESRVHIAACFLLTFALGLAYHVMVTFATGGGSSTNGWYIYCLIVGETLLATAGTMTVLPASMHPWILPFFTSCFALLDLYATHFVLIPYYVGMIAHKPNGLLATFHAGQYSKEGIGLAVSRLLANKPAFWNETALLVAWVLLIAATIAPLAASIRFRPGRL